MRFILISLIFLSSAVAGQIVTITPSSPSIFDEITLTIDVKLATDSRAAGLIGLTEGVYLWSGAGDDTNAFIYGPDGQTDFGQAVPGGEMTHLGDDVWEITLTPKNYYNIPDGVEITQLGLLLKNTDGTAQTEDLFIDIASGDFINFTSPADYDNTNFVSQSEIITISAESSSSGDLELFIDEGSGFVSVASELSAASISYNYQVDNSINLKVKVQADLSAGLIERVDSIEFFIQSATVEEPLPAGVTQGINYHNGDDTRVTLVLKAPLKETVYIVGDFTNWELDNMYQMKRDTDGETYWLEISGLVPGQEYIFQYWVDGVIKIGDPFADKVVDPWNDSFIPESVYPDLITYDKTAHGIASVLQTAQTAFNWDVSEDTWQAPPKEDLVIYELLVRDFVGTHDYKDLSDTLSYLKRLGVNAIELMPVMEFDGNESWGYNPSYFLAPDKYYGTKNDLKNFIQIAHQEGFAVILDMVLNHATGSNPYAAMYWDSANNQPSAENPWFNPTAKHEFNVFNDFNHESLYTQALVDTVNQYWIEEYHFDGFRFDLSKGFTQNNTIGDVAAWGAYDQSRVDLLTRMANKIWSYAPDAYIILEHFAASDEEEELASQGMLLWRNLNENYRQALAGHNPNASFAGANVTSHVSYMESHDEQRLMYEISEFGESSENYDTKNFKVSLDRVKMGLTFFYTLPGPKMMWQFQELGYDIDINFNGRVGNKPLPWGSGNLEYYENAERQKLYDTHRAIINLRNENKAVFNNGTYTTSLNASVKQIKIDHADMSINIIGNFALENQEVDPQFASTGWWYDFFSGDSINVENPNKVITLYPGEFHLYTSVKLETPDGNPYSAPNPPEILEIEDQVINENESFGPFEITLIAGDSALSAVDVAVEISNTVLFPTSNVEISGTGESRFLTLTPRPGRTGNAEITVTASDGFTASSVSFNLEVLEVITALKPSLDDYIYIYPNPATQYLIIDSGDEKLLEINLFSLAGKTHKLNVGDVRNTKTVYDISHLTAGIYSLEMVFSNAKVIRKIIIN